jgi:hypothetical protein
MSTTKTQNEMQSRFLLNIVIRQRSSILQLLAGKDQTLLIRGDTLLVLNLGLDIVNRVGRLNVERNGFTSQGLDENLKNEKQYMSQHENPIMG